MTDTNPPTLLGYFPAWYREHGVDHYLLWRAEDPSDQDGVVVNERGKALAFPSIAALEEFARRHNIEIADGEVGMHDLDAIAAWLADPQPEIMDCRELLAVLNLASDVSQSVGGNFTIYEPSLDDIYNKLFWGSNLPAMTPEGEHYVPTWDADEMPILVDAATRALAIFHDYVVML